MPDRVSPPTSDDYVNRMKDLIRKTFGGLTTHYYFRQLIFGLLVAGFVVWVATQNGRMMPWNMVVFTVISSLLYPYARFVYESIVGFVLGENVFFVNALLMLLVKFVTMSLCWTFAIFVAPVGLAYLYFHNSRAA